MFKSVLRSPITTAVLFVVAAGLLLFGGINTVQAAPRITSQDYRAEVVLTNIKTAITEYSATETMSNEVTGESTNMITRSGDDDLLTTFLADNNESEIKLGKTYPYKLAVRNVASESTNGIDQYVRVTVNKYWVLTDADGNPLKDTTGKDVTLDPSLIKLNFPETDGWTIDDDASTDERTVLYYSGILEPGEDSPAFTDTLTIDNSVIDKVTKTASGDVFDYDGVQFRIKASVDAVQTHNGEAAMKGAWGRTNK